VHSILENVLYAMLSEYTANTIGESARLIGGIICLFHLLLQFFDFLFWRLLEVG